VGCYPAWSFTKQYSELITPRNSFRIPPHSDFMEKRPLSRNFVKGTLPNLNPASFIHGILRLSTKSTDEICLLSYAYLMPHLRCHRRLRPNHNVVLNIYRAGRDRHLPERCRDMYQYWDLLKWLCCPCRCHRDSFDDYSGISSHGSSATRNQLLSRRWRGLYCCVCNGSLSWL
jgi:hypothetical protein